MTDHLQDAAPPTFSDEDLARLGSIVEWVQQSPDMWHHWPFMVRTRDYVASLRGSLAGVQQQQQSNQDKTEKGQLESSATRDAT